MAADSGLAVIQTLEELIGLLGKELMSLKPALKPLLSVPGMRKVARRRAKRSVPSENRGAAHC